MAGNATLGVTAGNLVGVVTPQMYGGAPGASDSTAAIANAVSAAAASGQAVFIGPGIWTMVGGVSVPSGVEIFGLRGSTIINFSVQWPSAPFECENNSADFFLHDLTMIGTGNGQGNSIVTAYYCQRVHVQNITVRAGIINPLFACVDSEIDHCDVDGGVVVGTLSAALVYGTSYTSITVASLSDNIGSGTPLSLNFNGQIQVVRTTAPVSSSSVPVVIPVAQFVSGYAYQVGSWVENIVASTGIQMSGGYQEWGGPYNNGQYCVRSSIHDNVVVNCGAADIFINMGYMCTIENNRCMIGHDMCLDLEYCRLSTMATNACSHGGNRGIAAETVNSEISIVGNVVDSATGEEGIRVTNDGGQYSQNFSTGSMVVSDNTVTRCINWGIVFQATNGVITNNVCRENIIAGIHLENANDVVVGNNFLEDNYGVGIDLYNSTKVQITGNVVRHNGNLNSTGIPRTTPALTLGTGTSKLVNGEQYAMAYAYRAQVEAGGASQSVIGPPTLPGFVTTTAVNQVIDVAAIALPTDQVETTTALVEGTAYASLVVGPPPLNGNGAPGLNAGILAGTILTLSASSGATLATALSTTESGLLQITVGAASAGNTIASGALIQLVSGSNKQVLTTTASVTLNTSSNTNIPVASFNPNYDYPVGAAVNAQQQVASTNAALLNQTVIPCSFTANFPYPKASTVTYPLVTGIAVYVLQTSWYEANIPWYWRWTTNPEEYACLQGPLLLAIVDTLGNIAYQSGATEGLAVSVSNYTLSLTVSAPPAAYLSNPGSALPMTQAAGTSSLTAQTYYAAAWEQSNGGTTTAGASQAAIAVAAAGNTVSFVYTVQPGSEGLAVAFYTAAGPLELGCIAPNGTITYSGGATAGLAVTMSDLTWTVTISASATATGTAEPTSNTTTLAAGINPCNGINWNYASGAPNEVSCDGNFIGSNGYHGIGVIGGLQMVSGGEIYDHTSTGIFGAAHASISVSGVRMYSLHDGIFAGSSISGCAVRGCVFDNSAGPITGHCVRFESAINGQSQQSVVSGNVFGTGGNVALPAGAIYTDTTRGDVNSGLAPLTISDNVFIHGITPSIDTNGGNGQWVDAHDNTGYAESGWFATTPVIPALNTWLHNPTPHRARIYMTGAAGVELQDVYGNSVVLPGNPSELLLDGTQSIAFTGSVPTAWRWYGV